MPDLIGFTAITLVSLITLLIALRVPSISNILYVALAIRILFMLAGHYIAPLPDSTADARSFENEAWAWGQEGFFNTLNYYNGPGSRFIVFVIAIPYSLIGRSILMAQSISLFFGLGCVILGWKIAKKLWDNHTANKIGWMIALFPSLILYSVLVMREVYICFFLLVALYGVVNWAKKDNFMSIILAMMGFIGATFFHGASMVGAIAFLTIIATISLKNFFKSLMHNRFNLKVSIFLLLFIAIAGLYLSNKINVQYLGTFESSTNIKNLLRKTHTSTKGVAAYPDWTRPKSLSELLYKGPVRAVYFIFSPFPWDIKKPKHLIGSLDALLYMYLAFLILCNIKVIWRDPALRIILIILLSYFIVFGVGVGNFGTGIRHRSKFVIILILLAGPLINRFIFFKNKENIKNL